MSECDINRRTSVLSQIVSATGILPGGENSVVALYWYYTSFFANMNFIPATIGFVGSDSQLILYVA